MKTLNMIISTLVLSILFYSCDKNEFAPEITDGLVAFYHFDGNAEDASDYNLHGSVYGATPVSDRDGVPNSAYSFDGIDDYIILGDDFDLPEWSISFRFKANSIPTYSIDDPFNSWTSLLVSNHPGMQFGGFHIVVSNFNGIDKILTWKVGMVETFDPELVSAPIEKSKWYDISLLCSSVSIKLFIDGDLLASYATDATISSQFGDPNLVVGCGRNRDLRFFDGTIDNIMIHDRILGDGEIQQLSIMK
jgi:hypothetical protein